MTYPLLKLVAAPTVGATVLFDFHDEAATPPRKFLLEGFSLGIPSLEGEVDVADPFYTGRQIEFTEQVEGTKEQVLTLHSQLARRLMRGRGWLLWQLAEDTDPVWFRLYRPRPESLKLDGDQALVAADTDSDVWAMPLVLPCESFAYGVRQVIEAQLVGNDAAFGTSLVLPTILGDAPAPLRVEVSGLSGANLQGRRQMFHLYSDDTQRLPVVSQIGTGDGHTAGTDTGAGTASGGFSGGTYRAVTFATNAAMATRLTGTFNVRPGRYKVLLRMARANAAATFDVRFGQYTGATYRYQPRVSVVPAVSAGDATWVDLGDVQLPEHAPPSELAATVTTQWALQLARTAGAGDARLDALLLVPVALSEDARAQTMFSYVPDVVAYAGAGSRAVWDGDLEQAWAVPGAGVVPSARTEVEGVFPAVVPGQVNVLTLLSQVNGRATAGEDQSSDAITESRPVAYSYQPRLFYGSGL